MKVVVYNGPREVQVKNVPDAKIERPTDVLVRITSTNICGSDLHMYEGRTDLEKGTVIRHANPGEVIEIGNKKWQLFKQLSSCHYLCLNSDSVICGRKCFYSKGALIALCQSKAILHVFLVLRLH